MVALKYQGLDTAKPLDQVRCGTAGIGQYAEPALAVVDHVLDRFAGIMGHGERQQRQITDIDSPYAHNESLQALIMARGLARG